MKKIKQRNFVQEYSLLINHSTVFKDRKRAFKNGESKHKKKYFWKKLKHSSTSLQTSLKICYLRIKNFLKNSLLFKIFGL